MAGYATMTVGAGKIGTQTPETKTASPEMALRGPLHRGISNPLLTRNSGQSRVIPDGIPLEFLPPYSPELQPAEHLWTPLREAVANQDVASLEDLDRILGDHCCTLADDPARISATTRFPWWPAFA
jgi:hypothetical protein